MTTQQDMPPVSVTAEIGAQLHQVMWRQKVSQRQVGELLGLHQGGVSARLRGKVPFTVDELVTICRTLDVSPVELLRNATEGPTINVGPSGLLPRLDSNQQPSG